jgi:hypothetical protein
VKIRKEVLDQMDKHTREYTQKESTRDYGEITEFFKNNLESWFSSTEYYFCFNNTPEKLLSTKDAFKNLMNDYIKKVDTLHLEYLNKCRDYSKDESSVELPSELVPGDKVIPQEEFRIKIFSLVDKLIGLIPPEKGEDEYPRVFNSPQYLAIRAEIISSIMARA